MMGLDIDLMVQALCNALLDNSVLVQRSTLDFLLSAFPMHNGQLTRTDLASVVEAAINVVLRRDMSLNRRLYLWLLGTPAHQSQANTLATANLAACSPVEATLLRRPRADSSSTTSEFDLAYFNTYSRELLVQALKHKVSTTGRDVRLGEDGHLVVLRPFRILISLLDKPEIGPVIIEDVLLSVFRSLYEEGTKRDDEIGPPPASSSSAATVPVSGAMTAKTLARDSKHVDELIKTANLLFGSFEAYFIWDFIGRLFSSACECTRTGMQRKGSLPSDSGIATCDAISIKELCHIVEFLLDIISLDVYPESTTEHLPDLLHQVITAATGCVEAASDVELTAILNICSKLLSRVQPSMATPSEDDPFDSDSPCRVPEAVANFRTNEVIANRVDDVSSYDKADDKKGDSIEDENANKMRVAGDAISNVTDCINREESTVEEISRHGDSKNQTGQSGIDVTAPDSKREELGSIKTDVSESDSDIVVADELLNERDAQKGQLNGDDISETMSSLASEATLESFEKTSAGVEKEVASRKEDVSCGSKEVATDPQKGPAYPMTDTSVKVSPQEKLTREMSLRSSSRDILRCAARQKGRDDKPREHLGLMQQCLGSFQEFFHCIIIHRFLESETVCEKCIDLLTLPVSECRTSDQDSLFDESSQCSADNDLLRTRLLESVSHPKVKPRLCTDEGHETFSRACRLLVDFASFPLYCADYQTVIDQMYSMEEVGSLPPWLQDLLTCSCYVSSFPLQASAIATMLDLITLTKSVHSETQNKTRDTGRMSVSEGRVSVVILPALLPRHLQHINDCTIFYQVTAQELWHHLSCENSEQHHRTAELFYTLHQVTPRSWICEDIMGNDLISEDETRRLNAFKKFSILWHLTRNMKADSTLGHEVRTFDRSMFVVLDSLKEESSPAKSLAVNWLTHVVQRGDISRVLRPVLLMLLHPDTARISVQHVNVHEPKRVSLAVESEDYDHNPEANIYAISSEGGNLIFHVNHNKPRMNLSRKSTEDLQSIALTVLSDKGRQTTAPVRAHSEAELTYERVNPKDLQLRFNPFGSVSSLDKLIFDGYEFPPSSGSMSQRQTKIPTSAKRLDKETCQREGIFFDGKEELEPAPEIPLEVFTEKEPTSEEVVAEILTEVLNRVMVKVVENQLEDQRKGSVTSSQMCDHDLLNAIEAASLEMDSTSSSENDLCEASAQQNRKGATGLKVGVNGAEGELEEAVPEGIHQLHMHLLLYTQAYDYRRTIYALSTVRSMLVQCPRLVVTAMATTTISSVRVPHMVQVQTLLARHRKSVFGKNFFGELPAEVLSGYRSNMFLEVVISLCLYCMRGYFPNLMMSRLTDDELLGNNLVHIQAAEVLTLLLSELLSIMRDSGRSFVSYISDLLGRCKLQKALLHTLLASVYDTRSKTHNQCLWCWTA